MTDETLSRYIRQYIECQPTDQVNFVWHGGEPTLKNLGFYKKVVNLQNRYANGHQIFNSIQTNGTLINDDWCRFLRDNNWLVGLSVDGPQNLHDSYRHDPAGKPSFMRVLKAIRLLDKFGVDWNAMATVNAYNADHPIDFYNFFKEIGCRYIQFSPVVERLDDNGNLLPGYTPGGKVAHFSVSPTQWGDFLISLFNEWVKHDVGTFFIQIFDATLANWMGVEPGLCTLSSLCGHATVMEHNGDVFCCDHFVFEDYKLGNIHENTILEMLLSDRQKNFAKAKGSGLPSRCFNCKFNFACHGECPRNRFLKSQDDDESYNYLCEGYLSFFNHVAPFMNFMCDELEAGRAPANIMNSSLVKGINGFE